MNLGEAQTRARRRAIARQHHPDLGGDPERYLAAMQELDAAAHADGSRPGDGRTTPLTVRTTVRSRVTRRVRRAVRRLRQRIPRSIPGSRRFGHL